MDRDLRRLLFASGTLLVLLFVGRAVIGSVWDDGDLRKSVAGLRRALSAGGEACERPDRADLEAATQRVTQWRQQLESLVPLLGYVRPPEFDVPAGASPDLRYIEVLRREQDDLVQAARYVGKSVPPDLGMPVPNPTGLEDVLAALRSLHIVHLTVEAALAAGVDAVDAIRVPTALGARRDDGGFVKARKVEFELVGAPAALHRTLATLAAGSPWLGLDDVRLEGLDEDGARARCRLSVVSVTLDGEAPVRPTAGKR